MDILCAFMYTRDMKFDVESRIFVLDSTKILYICQKFSQYHNYIDKGRDHMTWIIYAILDCVATIIAYITNPIVVLFANEYGDLPHILRYWQTYDNPLDIEWVISEGWVPKCIRYDFNKHYRYTPEWDSPTGIGYVDILDPDFTIKERIQRYFCRLYWLYRNTAYGFSYEVTGRDIDTDKMTIVRNDSKEDWLSYDGTVGIWNRAWVLYYNKPWCSKFKLRVYLGWKGKGYNDHKPKRCMLALFISPFRKVED